MYTKRCCNCNAFYLTEDQSSNCTYCGSSGDIVDGYTLKLLKCQGCWETYLAEDPSARCPRCGSTGTE